MEECLMCANVNHLYPLECDKGHTFCLSCVKGLCLSSSPTVDRSLCPLCRTPISKKYIRTIVNQPEIIKKVNIEPQLTEYCQNNEYIWIYEGRNNGWWLYDSDIQDALEKAHTDHEDTVSWVICGQNIVIDVKNNIQQTERTGAERNISRIHRKDTKDYLIKGWSGMR